MEQFSVFSVWEAWQAQKVAKKDPSFLIMEGPGKQEMEWAVEQGIDFFLSDPGVLQYGFSPTREILIDYMVKKTNNENPMHRIVTRGSRVTGLKRISKGSFIGYGTSFPATNDMMVTTIPVGYARGFFQGDQRTGELQIAYPFARMHPTDRDRLIRMKTVPEAGITARSGKGACSPFFRPGGFFPFQQGDKGFQ